MDTKIKELTTEELRVLISDTIRETLEELSEDIAALSSNAYIGSIAEARNDYKEGKTKNFEEIFDT